MEQASRETAQVAMRAWSSGSIAARTNTTYCLTWNVYERMDKPVVCSSKGSTRAAQLLDVCQPSIRPLSRIHTCTREVCTTLKYSHRFHMLFVFI